jgi:hypothetical protein
MLGIFTFFACITFAMAASVPEQTITNVGGMFRFAKKEIFENN